jgi:xanthine dehydrogenase accessory factor
MLNKTVVIRGGGDLASGVALRLHHAGFPIIILEIPQPLAVRRTVSFAQAVYQDEIVIEEVRAIKANNPKEVIGILKQKNIPVIIDELANCLSELKYEIIIDARMLKKPADYHLQKEPLIIGLGPGFTAGLDCHAVVETKRGPFLGRVYWQGNAEADTGQPEAVGNHQDSRVLRSPGEGIFTTDKNIAEIVEAGQKIGEVEGQAVCAQFRGILRGILHSGLHVSKGVKIGDIDPRLDPRLCTLVSDKALAVGGGTLEAILQWLSTTGEQSEL